MLALWKYLPAGLAHELAPMGLTLYADFCDEADEATSHWKPFHWRGLHFSNPLGIAGGVDKNGHLLPLWPKLGCGFAEIGTVTPRPQSPNPGKIMDRDWEHKALWNKMGFPSEGAHSVFYSLHHFDRKIPVFVNIGKNRSTPNEKAVHDYLECVSILQSVTDVFVVNVSSPNTKGLRDLQNRDQMEKLLSILSEKTIRPILVKLSPDMTDEQLKDVIEGCLDGGCAGFVLTNTTLSRTPDLHFAKEGGVSGAPLAILSKSKLQKVITLLGPRRKGLLLVSAGGVLTPEDVFERLQLGADLVQTYSGLVFNGPSFFHQTAKAAKELP